MRAEYKKDNMSNENLILKPCILYTKMYLDMAFSFKS